MKISVEDIEKRTEELVENDYIFPIGEIGTWTTSRDEN